MIFNLTDPLTRCKAVTAGILSAGFISATTIYLTATESYENSLAEFESSRKYAYELERIGGKAALVANCINNWFAGLWHGQTLSYTIAAVTIILAVVYYFIATSLEAEAQDIRAENQTCFFQDEWEKGVPVPFSVTKSNYDLPDDKC